MSCLNRRCAELEPGNHQATTASDGAEGSDVMLQQWTNFVGTSMHKVATAGDSAKGSDAMLQLWGNFAGTGNHKRYKLRAAAMKEARPCYNCGSVFC